MSLQMAGEAARNQHIQWELKRRGLEVSVFPCLIYTISCSLSAGAGPEQSLRRQRGLEEWREAGRLPWTFSK